MFIVNWEALLRHAWGGEGEALCPPLNKLHVASAPFSHMAKTHGPPLGESGLFSSSLQRGVHFCESLPQYSLIAFRLLIPY